MNPTDAISDITSSIIITALNFCILLTKNLNKLKKLLIKLDNMIPTNPDPTLSNVNMPASF